MTFYVIILLHDIKGYFKAENLKSGDLIAPKKYCLLPFGGVQ